MPSQASFETASSAQVNFIRDLLTEREGNPEAEKVRQRLNHIRESGRALTKSGARRAIERLKEIPKTVTADQVQFDPTGKPVVAEGFYALPSPNDDEHPLRFYRVRHGSGTWQGWTFVDVQASDEFYPLSKDSQRNVLEAIVADPEAGPRYGQQIGRCYKCRRTLTDETSRAMGIGPDCRTRS